MNPKAILTVHGVRKRVTVNGRVPSRQTVWRWFSMGILPGHRRGRVWVIEERALNLWLAGDYASQYGAVGNGP